MAKRPNNRARAPQRPQRGSRWKWAGFVVPAAVLVAIVIFGDTLTGTSDPTATSAPSDPAIVTAGEQLFRANCAACHGADLQGTQIGPPFLDVIYAPNHHGDESFQRAVAQGVTPHHWGFGSMPPIGGLSRDDVAAIVAYVRTEQLAAGILRDPSHP